jgi:cytochrome c oxidase cbb3-type subunit 2
MGPDVARLGGKYPDEWHRRHMEDPMSIEPRSNMPSYAFLNDGEVNPAYTERKMKVLGFPFTDEEIKALAGKTEMDAIIAYMQKLGADLPREEVAMSAPAGENPYAGDDSVLAEGKAIYDRSCGACHGADLDGDIGPELEAGSYDDDELFEMIHDGITDGGMPSFARLGADRIWKLITFIQSEER